MNKILSNSGKYKYAIIGSDEQQISNKFVAIFREAVISVKSVLNIVVIKTLKGLGSSVCSFVDKLNLNELVGAVNGDDTVMLIFPSAGFASESVSTLSAMLG